MQFLCKLRKTCSSEGVRSRVWNQYDWLTDNGPSACIPQESGRSSIYFQFCSLRSVRNHSVVSSNGSPHSFSNGSAWSANGNETSRLPVIQLLISQKTMPSDNRSPGGVLVNTTGR